MGPSCFPAPLGGGAPGQLGVHLVMFEEYHLLLVLIRAGVSLSSGLNIDNWPGLVPLNRCRFGSRGGDPGVSGSSTHRE